MFVGLTFSSKFAWGSDIFFIVRTTCNYMENNLPITEFNALKSLIRNKELIIQKLYETNTVVLLNRKDYITKKKLILAAASKSKKMQIDSKVLNNLIHIENKIVKLLKRLQKNQKTADKVYIELYSTGSKLGILYGLCITHKIIVDEFPTFRLILPALDSQNFLCH